ncbi:MAG TPA: fatty acyl-AMP ligase [Polyangiaceae bacterium]|jgi:fatty-acyl-CoA synthase
MKLPKLVAPTLVEAVGQLARHTDRGFVFVKPDGQERSLSFREIHEEAQRRGAHMAARGIEKGDRVAMVIPDGDEFVLSFLGAIFAGAVPVPIYPQLSFKNVESYHDTVAHIARASGAKLLLTTPSTKQYVDPVLPRVETLGDIVTVDEFAAPAPGVLDVKVNPEDTAFLQFTSGSTSRPKGVVVSHANLAWNSEAFMIHGLARVSAVDKGVSWLPLFHDMGLIGYVIGPLFTDIPCVFLPTASFVRAPRSWLQTIHKHRGTIIYAPNFAYQLVAKRIKEKELADLDLSCVKRAGCGAEPIQARTLRDFAEKTRSAGFDPKAFLPSYGMAEATLAITFVPHSTGVKADVIDPAALEKGTAKPVDAAALQGAGVETREIVNCGRPFPEHQVAIVDDETGRALGERQVGHIVTKGPSVTSGYFQEPELTAASWRKGPDGDTWLYTGDLGYLADGDLYICGRLKDIIIIRGRNFYPTDLEWVVSELPGVRRGNVVAFGVDVEGEEQLVICAEAFQSEAAGLTEQITQAIAAQVGLSVHRVAIVPQGSLPRTSSGKAQRRKTKQMFLDGTLPKPRTGGAGAVDGAAESAASADEA